MGPIAVLYEIPYVECTPCGHNSKKHNEQLVSCGLFSEKMNGKCIGSGPRLTKDPDRTSRFCSEICVFGMIGAFDCVWNVGWSKVLIILRFCMY